MASPLLLASFAVAGAAISWKGGDLLVDAADRLGDHYGLPPIVQGAVIAAVGSSFPEFSSTVIATLRYGAFDIGIGAVVGSALFNILVIPGVSTIAGGGSMTTDRDLVYKEAQFYLLSLAVVLLTVSLAVIFYPLGPGRLVGEITPLLALLPLGMYGLYVFIQYHDSVDHRRHATRNRVHVGRQWARLGASLAVILVGADLLVRAAVGFGDLFGTPPLLWGMTVVAAGTSLPDTFVSVAAARARRPAVSLANVFGSNVFALLVALPAGVLAAGGAPVDFAAVVPMMGVLVVASLAFFAIIRTDLLLSRNEAYVLLGLYGAFLAWLVVESVGLLAVAPR